MALRVPSILTLAAVGVATAIAVPAAGQAARPAAKPVAWVKLSSCSRETHEAVFHGRMRRLTGADRMWMRFTLLERTGVADPVEVAAPGLGIWRKSRKGVRGFGYRQAVRNLSENSLYRARVDFRWYDADGELLETARRRSQPCPRPSQLPNLRSRIEGMARTPVPGSVRYRIRVSNRGRAEALAVPVRLWVDGLPANTVKVESLRAGQSTRIGLRGPACESRVRVEVDPDGTIVESGEGDNSDELSCAEVQALIRRPR